VLHKLLDISARLPWTRAHPKVSGRYSGRKLAEVKDEATSDVDGLSLVLAMGSAAQQANSLDSNA
jgi:hypothetical protein